MKWWSHYEKSFVQDNAISPGPALALMVWYGMVWYTSIYIARLSHVSNALGTLVPGKQPSFQALFERSKVLLCAEVVRQRVPNRRAMHSECSAANSGEPVSWHNHQLLCGWPLICTRTDWMWLLVPSDGSDILAKRQRTARYGLCPDREQTTPNWRSNRQSAVDRLLRLITDAGTVPSYTTALQLCLY